MASPLPLLLRPSLTHSSAPGPLWFPPAGALLHTSEHPCHCFVQRLSLSPGPETPPASSLYLPGPSMPYIHRPCQLHPAAPPVPSPASLAPSPRTPSVQGAIHSSALAAPIPGAAGVSSMEFSHPHLIKQGLDPGSHSPVPRAKGQQEPFPLSGEGTALKMCPKHMHSSDSPGLSVGKELCTDCPAPRHTAPNRSLLCVCSVESSHTESPALPECWYQHWT